MKNETDLLQQPKAEHYYTEDQWQWQRQDHMSSFKW